MAETDTTSSLKLAKSDVTPPRAADEWRQPTTGTEAMTEAHAGDATATPPPALGNPNQPSDVERTVLNPHEEAPDEAASMADVKARLKEPNAAANARLDDANAPKSPACNHP